MNPESLREEAARLRAEVAKLGAVLSPSVLASLSEQADRLEALAAGAEPEAAAPGKRRRVVKEDPRAFRFGVERIEALPPAKPGTRDRYRDSEEPALTLRVTDKGAKTFYFIRRPKGGRPEAVMICPYQGAESIATARREAGRIKGEAAQGISRAEALRKKKAERTFAELFADYYAIESQPKKRTHAEDLRIFKQYLADPLGKRKVSAIHREDLAGIHVEITRAGHAPQANRVLALLSSVFNWARRFGFEVDNPARDIPKNPEKSRARFLKPEELPAFFQALGNLPNPTQRDFFLLALLTGARRENVLAAEWRHIDLTRAVWSIPRTKNGEPQDVALVPEAVGLLQARRPAHGGGYVFAIPGTKAGHLTEPRKSWDKLLRLASLYRLFDALQAAGHLDEAARKAADALALSKLPTAEATYRARAQAANINPADFDMTDLRIHDLRRSLGSWQARTGANQATIGKSLNHKTPQATAIYTRLTLDPVRESVTKAVSAMLTAGGVKAPAEVIDLAETRRKSAS